MTRVWKALTDIWSGFRAGTYFLLEHWPELILILSFGFLCVVIGT
jgi:hypothetical protein